MNQQYQVNNIAAFLGRPSAKALIKAASHMSRFVDSRAPTTTSPEELVKLRDSSNFGQLIELRDNLRADVQHQSGTVEKARLAGTKLYEMYYNADCQVRAARSRINKLAKVNTRKEFFETINTADINAQLSDPSWNLAFYPRTETLKTKVLHL
ncbi:hypothetical protein B0J13DRAFT_613519 [Dactylonectria estremocensis]|uniref:Uncharacterized protein n=1 Tax=Dactylonectria estremocensis TaxID=1079267 RepID=A0A9P9DAZ1_9HYPO|nr:hypothetical protein B0J13DRAFT_613519 [Dactylonectria estremocensis]